MERRDTFSVKVGNQIIGSGHPIAVQSMVNVDIRQTQKVITQIENLYQAGCEIVRISIPNLESIDMIKYIKSELNKKKIEIPIVADVHFSTLIAEKVLPYVDKVRINPCNYNNLSAFRTLVKSAKKLHKSIRIGVNYGSVYKKLNKSVDIYSEIFNNVLEHLKIAEQEDFNQIVLSFKASNVKAMITANLDAVDKLDKLGYKFPLHLGVTEAGNDSYARVKSSVGIGTLLLQGIGDTIRVSLTEDPAQEIQVAYEILQACGARTNFVEYIACPSCGRTQFDIQSVFKEVKDKTKHYKNITIAVMGCVVNGIGEMGNADFGLVGSGQGKVNLYHKGQILKSNIPQESAVDELVEIISRLQ